MPFTDWVTFPAALTSVFTFLNKTLNLFYCLLRGRKKHLWFLHTYFKRQSLSFTQTRGFPMHAATSVFPPAHAYFGAAEKEEPYLSFSTFHSSSCCCVFLLLWKRNTPSFSHSLAFSSQKVSLALILPCFHLFLHRITHVWNPRETLRVFYDIGVI